MPNTYIYIYHFRAGAYNNFTSPSLKLYIERKKKGKKEKKKKKKKREIKKHSHSTTRPRRSGTYTDVFTLFSDVCSVYTHGAGRHPRGLTRSQRRLELLCRGGIAWSTPLTYVFGGIRLVSRDMIGFLRARISPPSLRAAVRSVAVSGRRKGWGVWGWGLSLIHI